MLPVVLADAASWGLAGVFAVAAVHKVKNHLEFRGILDQYRIMPPPLVPVAASVVVALEWAVCLMLVVPAWRWLGAALAAGLLLLYAAAIALNLYGRGRTSMDCGCGGEATPLSGWLLLRNGLLALLACAPWLAVPSAATGWAGGILATLMTAVLWLAYAVGNQLLANQGRAPELGAAHG
ncbi:MAG: methylamine utilization protein MauE [Gammaproteobacteria bacterium]|nr:methylamine utilization protein MauE [Gammaproteobacteria bacterium]